MILLHFLKPELDSSWRMISEYEIGRFGWMMSLTFFCWGISVLSLLAALWKNLDKFSGWVVRFWLILIGLALFGAGIFVTNPILDESVNTANTLHSLCGTIVIMTFPIAASILAGKLSRLPFWQPLKSWLLWGTLLMWFGMLAFFFSIPISNVINPSAGRVGPQVYLGWPNRFMVFVYILWIFLVARHAGLQKQDI